VQSSRIILSTDWGYYSVDYENCCCLGCGGA
jgi:hypothetical protein